MEHTKDYEEKAPAAAGSNDLDSETIDAGSIAAPRTHLKRHLGNRQVQLIAIGGSIGTALFVSIGRGLEAGGAGSLLLAFIIFSCALGLVNNGMAEMAVYMPSEGGFIRMAGRWVDEAFGFMAGWNFFLYEALLIPWEISALNLVLTYWSDNIPIGAVCAVCIVSYAALNIFAVKYYGEAEFWLASGKVLLIAIVFMFTFVTMVGGNPQHHAYGFSNFGNPSAFLESHSTGSLGRFEGFLAALWVAAFTIVGPEYLSMVAGETKRPRTYLKSAFKTMYWRFGVFFIGGALCVGIVLRADDPTLSSILDGSSAGGGTAAASPYVIAMANMKITVLPHITNALLVSSIYSAGNALTYCAVRSLHGLALAGQAPAILKKCTKSGVPIYCYFVTMLFPLLSFLQISAGSAQVITWFANLVTAGQIINYIVMCITYIFFHRAMIAQGFDRGTLPYRGYFQPYCAYIGLAAMILVVTCYGYTVLLPGNWDVGNFFSYYTMLFLAPLTYGGWKIVKRTKFIPSSEADLVWDKPMIDQYEMETAAEASRGFWRDVRQMQSPSCSPTFKTSKTQTIAQNVHPRSESLEKPRRSLGRGSQGIQDILNAPVLLIGRLLNRGRNHCRRGNPVPLDSWSAMARDDLTAIAFPPRPETEHNLAWICYELDCSHYHGREVLAKFSETRQQAMSAARRLIVRHTVMPDRIAALNKLVEARD